MPPPKALPKNMLPKKRKAKRKAPAAQEAPAGPKRAFAPSPTIQLVSGWAMHASPSWSLDAGGKEAAKCVETSAARFAGM